MTEMLISVPLDSDGFLRRECPACEREFKWFSGKTADAPEDGGVPDVYFCPYCGHGAGLDQWWTQGQIEQIRAEAAPEFMRAVTDELKRSFRSKPSDLIQFSTERGRVPPPPPLIEPNDMVIVESPCHGWEPIKVVEDSLDLLHCLVCGDEFTVR